VWRLLVHDPDTDKASAAVNVNVGNFSDEDDMPGMAHASGTKTTEIQLAFTSALEGGGGRL
jgi:hypothetical protein